MKKIWVLMVVLLIGLMVFNIPAVAQTANTKAATAAAATATTVAVIPSLAIKVPNLGYEGEKVLMKVVELPDGGPVSVAGVWAVDVNNSGNLAAVSSAEMDGIGIFLGWTDSNGEVVYIFGESSKYLLVAFKDGYQPGFNWIKIQPLKAMAIKGPTTALVGQTCEFTVFEPAGGAVVPGVGVWAWAVGDATTLPSTEADLVSAIIDSGIFLGYTNNEGQVLHAFSEAGPYLLLATKTGYKPAFSKILIGDLKELAIRAPETVNVFEPFSLRVVEKSVLTVEIPVAKAAVWAVVSTNTLDTLSDEEAVAKTGIFLGWTDEKGYISPEPYLRVPDKYWLVAFKAGYVPGISQIKVLPLKTLAIKGPSTALVGQTCEFTVYEPASGAAVPGAGVWALAAGDPAALTSTSNNLASVIIGKGIFLGYTNNFGQVYHAFTQAGPYLLLATKQGYSPAFSKIKITEVKELAIRAPQTVRVLQPVSIRVVEKSMLTVEIPVSSAAVWAISMVDNANLDKSADLNTLVKSQGIFLGWTNNQGYISPQPRFSRAGQYWLIAIKDGYVPGIKTITVVSAVPATATPLPLTKSVNSITTR